MPCPFMPFKKWDHLGAAFGRGLDVGCGTGQSPIALANYCRQVVWIEPSEAMLQKSIAHPSIAYRP